jgi:hypothetical protein
MADDTRNRITFTTVLEWAVLLGLPAAIAAVYFLGIAPARRASLFISCRNHATFVGKGLDSYVLKHGQLPHGPGLPGEELVCRIDYGGVGGLNCHGGAPGQGVGGWQMVNASPKSWNEILRAMKGKRIPVIWCGKPHRPRHRWKGTVRVVIAFTDFPPPSPGSLAELLEAHMGTDGYGKKELVYFRNSIVYGMPEEELKARLAEINAILRKNGEPETPINIEGRPDYGKIAKPYQSMPEAPAK